MVNLSFGLRVITSNLMVNVSGVQSNLKVLSKNIDDRIRDPKEGVDRQSGEVLPLPVQQIQVEKGLNQIVVSLSLKQGVFLCS